MDYRYKTDFSFNFLLLNHFPLHNISLIQENNSNYLQFIIFCFNPRLPIILKKILHTFHE